MNLSDKGIIIRRTIESDLHQIYNEGMRETIFTHLTVHFNAENLAEIFMSENTICFTAARKKTVLGFIFGFINDKECRIQWLLVKETFRKAGIGMELLHFFMEKAKKNGVEDFFIAVFENNSESVKFFSKYGFLVKNNFMELYRKSYEKFYPGLSE